MNNNIMAHILPFDDTQLQISDTAQSYTYSGFEELINQIMLFFESNLYDERHHLSVGNPYNTETPMVQQSDNEKKINEKVDEFKGLFGKWPEYNIYTIEFYVKGKNFWRMFSYLLLYPNVIFQIVGLPLQLFKIYYFGQLKGNFSADLIDRSVKFCSQSIAAAFHYILWDPWYIFQGFLYIFFDFAQIIWYNTKWGWFAFDATFKFSTEGIFYGFETIFWYFKILANDFDKFVQLHVDNIWTVMAFIFAWPVYLPYIIWAWLFGWEWKILPPAKTSTNYDD